MAFTAIGAAYLTLRKANVLKHGRVAAPEAGIDAIHPRSGEELEQRLDRR